MRSTIHGARWALGSLGATLLVFAAGCPSTTLGPGSTSSSASSGGGGGGGGGGTTAPAPTIEWRQTVDFSGLGMTQLRGWMRFTAGGARAYVADWSNAVALLTFTDGLALAPTKLTTGDACNSSDIRFSADEQVAFVGSYYKWTCNQAVSAFVVQGDGTFGGEQYDTAWAGSISHEAPDFTESIAVHPSGAWLYVGFANTHPTTAEVAENSQIGRVDVASDGGLSNEKVVATLASGGVTEMTLAFSPAGDALYAVQYETGKVNRFFVDGVTGNPIMPTVVTATPYAEVGPICTIGGKEHVYIGSGGELTGGVHHLVFDGPVLEASTVTGQKDHPSLAHVHSIVADEDCRYLYAVGGGAGAVIHVLEVDPATGSTTWVSGLNGVAQLVNRNRISMSPDGRFLYTVASCESAAACTAGAPVPPVVNVFEIVAP